MLDNPDIYLAGGFIRAVISGEEPADVDLLVSEGTDVEAVAAALDSTAKYRSANAITLRRPDIAVQIVHRWRFDTPMKAAESLDFTVCQAVIWCGMDEMWDSYRCPSYYQDLAAKRLVYTKPNRDEDAGGSTLRLLKYARKGYHASPETIAEVISRMNSACDAPASAASVAGLLREVDPLTFAHNTVS